MRYVLNYQAVRGINMYNLFGIPYCREGFLMTGEKPFFTEKHACYSDLAVFNQFAERLSYLSSLGESVTPTALYMPVCDLWAEQNIAQCARAYEKAGDDLEDARIPFDIIDDDVLEKADPTAMTRGQIVMGKACYTSVVIPPCKYMPDKTKDALCRFIAGGGQVFVIAGDVMPELPGSKTVENAKSILTSPLKISGETEKLRLAVRRAENGRLYLLFNEEDKEQIFSVYIVEEVYILKPESGKIICPHRDGDALMFTLKSGEMVFLWQGGVPVSEEEHTYTEETVLDGVYTFRRSRRFVIGDMQFISEEIREEEKRIELGDWAEVVGRDFSGSGIYKTRFSVPEKKSRLQIDLGQVHETCEAFLNGKSLGVRVMSPYTYEISADMLQPDNTLEIRVSNTSANEYVYTKSFDKWKDWQLSPYHSIEQVFHEDSLSGGLYGPVKICY